jgi:uncharacterized protein with HEPN domain
MLREAALTLEDIVEYGSKIARYTHRMSLEEFRANELVFDAVVRNLELLGGAASLLPDTVTATMPGIAWSRTAAFGDVIARRSVSLDPGVVWDLVQTKIPELVRCSSVALERLRE